MTLNGRKKIKWTRSGILTRSPKYIVWWSINWAIWQPVSSTFPHFECHYTLKTLTYWFWPRSTSFTLYREIAQDRFGRPIMMLTPVRQLIFRLMCPVVRVCLVFSFLFLIRFMRLIVIFTFLHDYRKIFRQKRMEGPNFLKHLDLDNTLYG